MVLPFSSPCPSNRATHDDKAPFAAPGAPINSATDVRCHNDTVEKVAAWPLQFARKKVDLSDRPTNCSRAPVKGNETPENGSVNLAGVDYLRS